MKKIIGALMLSIMMMVSFASCTANSGAGESSFSDESSLESSASEDSSSEDSSSKEEVSNPDPSSVPEESQSVSETTLEPSGKTTLDTAISNFQSLYPSATINISKQEGDAFYVEGYDDEYIYKYKILDTGEVVLNKSIPNRRGGK